MSDFFSRFAALPPYGVGALIVLVLYAIQSEVRFGSRARSMHAGGQADRGSTLALSLASVVPVLGFALAMRANAPGSKLPDWFRHAVVSGLPAVAWLGVALGFAGLALRLWAVLRLRDRYTRTLLMHQEHDIERGGPYGWVRHPGYLGSLLCLNGAALASGNYIVLIASLAVTCAAYAYRISVEDEMLVDSFGAPYADYRNEVRALLPLRRSATPRVPRGG